MTGYLLFKKRKPLDAVAGVVQGVLHEDVIVLFSVFHLIFFPNFFIIVACSPGKLGQSSKRPSNFTKSLHYLLKSIN